MFGSRWTFSTARSETFSTTRSSRVRLFAKASAAKNAALTALHAALGEMKASPDDVKLLPRQFILFLKDALAEAMAEGSFIEFLNVEGPHLARKSVFSALDFTLYIRSRLYNPSGRTSRSHPDKQPDVSLLRVVKSVDDVLVETTRLLLCRGCDVNRIMHSGALRYSIWSHFLMEYVGWANVQGPETIAIQLGSLYRLLGILLSHGADLEATVYLIGKGTLPASEVLVMMLGPDATDQLLSETEAPDSEGRDSPMRQSKGAQPSASKERSWPKVSQRYPVEPAAPKAERSSTVQPTKKANISAAGRGFLSRQNDPELWGRQTRPKAPLRYPVQRPTPNAVYSSTVQRTRRPGTPVPGEDSGDEPELWDRQTRPKAPLRYPVQRPTLNAVYSSTVQRTRRPDTPVPGEDPGDESEPWDSQVSVIELRRPEASERWDSQEHVTELRAPEAPEPFVKDKSNSWPVTPNGTLCGDAAAEITSIGDKVKNATVCDAFPLLLTQQISLADESIVSSIILFVLGDGLACLEKYWHHKGTGDVRMYAIKPAQAAGLKIILTSSSDAKLTKISDKFRHSPISAINYTTKFSNWYEEILTLTAVNGGDLIVDVGGALTIVKSMKCTRCGGIVCIVSYLSKRSHGDLKELIPSNIDKRITLRTPQREMDAPKLRVAVTQAEPEWLDLGATVDKTIRLIAEAAANGARLIAFPEVWITGYPGWIWGRTIDPPMSTRYTLNALAIESSEMTRIRQAAQENSVAVVLGFAERSHTHSLYISQAIISPEGEILLTRRKIKPTHVERTLFGDGSGSDLNNVVEIDFGGGIGKVKVGTLSCWEHAQPLLKYHTYTQGEAIHISMWPPIDPHGGVAAPTHWAQSAEGCLNLSQTYAIEGGTFVLHCTGVANQKCIDTLQTENCLGFNKPGGGHSCVIGPDGRRLTPPLGDGNPSTEGLVYADLDLTMIVTNRQFIDVVGHYSRPDLLWVGVDKKQKTPVVERAGVPGE
ncbi:hypothetical protein NUW58_g5672 [Xylaria curta]|uniref:Uncharacterized protein n=1 Tax=Xylaria curta TaxID=42375 RepID=A0ACC1P1T0_9PEZI|nr:hypothetical protein NUW58_g5672 [Xylaria curta]